MNNRNCAVIAVAALFALAVGFSSDARAENKYTAQMVGTWEISGEADLFVLAKNNSCYRQDEDGIKTSRRGRWAADSSKLTIELKYNGKKFRSVFKYEMVSKDHFKLDIVKSFVDGKPKKPKRSKLVAKRWKKSAGGK